MDTVVLDVDGTLLDSNYHHTVAWARAFDTSGSPCRCGGSTARSAWAATSSWPPSPATQVESESTATQIRDRWEQEYDEIIDETVLLPGAKELLAALRERGSTSRWPARASRSTRSTPSTCSTPMTWRTPRPPSEDAEESKPDPELVEEALSRLGGGSACVIGDSVWDVEAAKRRRRAGVRRAHRRHRPRRAGASRSGRGLRGRPRPARSPGRLAGVRRGLDRPRWEIGRATPGGERAPAASRTPGAHASSDVAGRAGHSGRARCPTR